MSNIYKNMKSVLLLCSKVESKYLQVYDVDWALKHPHFEQAPRIRNNIALIRLAKMIPRSSENTQCPI